MLSAVEVDDFSRLGPACSVGPLLLRQSACSCLAHGTTSCQPTWQARETRSPVEVGQRARTCLKSVYDTLKQRMKSLEVQIMTRIPTLRESRSGTDRCVALQENQKGPSYCDHHFTGQWLPPLGVCCTRPLKRARRAERARRRNSENNLLLFIGTSTKASEPVYV